MFSIRDSKAEIYNVPFFAKTTAEAERNLRETMKDERTLINKYPEDFSLWMLGEYDDQTGECTSHPPTHLINAVQLQDQGPAPQGIQENLRITQ